MGAHWLDWRCSSVPEESPASDESFEVDDERSGVSNQAVEQRARPIPKGDVRPGLAARYETPTVQVAITLELTSAGRFVWRSHGCTGTMVWTGEFRYQGDRLELIPDRLKELFGWQRTLFLRQHRGQRLLVTEGAVATFDATPTLGLSTLVGPPSGGPGGGASRDGRAR